jgi:hypothetical protein
MQLLKNSTSSRAAFGQRASSRPAVRKVIAVAQ